MTIDFAIILLGLLAIGLAVQVMADAWAAEDAGKAREAGLGEDDK